ncbi:MAG TPA: DNA-binding protein WhiA [Firmicutes bacterium]|nr:DNA-binding protein WhiA [Bacillota bacterium]
MGFSEETKRELAHVYPETNCCRLAELSAYYDFNGYHFGSYLDINHFMPLIARKILTLTKQVFPEAATQVLVQKARARKNQVCTVRVLTKQAAEEFYQALRDQDYLDDDKKVLAKNCCQRAYVRGAFLSHGSVTNPERTYHLEIFTEKSEVAERVLLTINSLGLSARMTGRKGDLVVYLKDGDQIVTLLNLMGAHKALLHVENVRIVKDMRNQVNRLVNCETANVDKTIKAAVAQIEAVEKIQKHMDLSELPPKMAEIARLRVENPYASLKELGEMAEPPISKSGVSYRIQQLINMSKSLD